MDTSETYIKMCNCEEIQKVLGEYDGYLTPPDDGIYHRIDPYPVAVIYSNQLLCPTCGAYLSTQFCPKDGGEASTSGKYDLEFGGPCSKDLKGCKIVWLPRQDQLQEIVGQLPSETYLVRKLYEETFEYLEHYNSMVYKPYYLQFKSMEQLWLAFVMKEKYNKVWDGEKWDTIDKGA